MPRLPSRRLMPITPEVEGLEFDELAQLDDQLRMTEKLIKRQRVKVRKALRQKLGRRLSECSDRWSVFISRYSMSRVDLDALREAMDLSPWTVEVPVEKLIVTRVGPAAESDEESDELDEEVSASSQQEAL